MTDETTTEGAMTEDERQAYELLMAAANSCGDFLPPWFYLTDHDKRGVLAALAKARELLAGERIDERIKRAHDAGHTEGYRAAAEALTVETVPLTEQECFEVGQDWCASGGHDGIGTTGIHRLARMLVEHQRRKTRPAPKAEADVPAAVRTIARALRDDPGYRISWVANIAMAFKDRFPKTRVGELARVWPDTLHKVANEAAEAFVDLLCKDSPAQPEAPKAEPAPRVPTVDPRRPCAKCGRLRTKAEGAEVFSTCEGPGYNCDGTPEAPTVPREQFLACETHLSELLAAKDRECAALRAELANECSLRDGWENAAEKYSTERDEASAKLAEVLELAQENSRLRDSSAKQAHAQWTSELDTLRAKLAEAQAAASALAKSNAEVVDELARLKAQPAQAPTGAGLPANNVSSRWPQDIELSGGARVRAVSNEEDGFFASDGVRYYFTDEGKTWRRVPAEPTKEG